MSPRRAGEDVSQLGQSSAYEGASSAGARGKSAGCGLILTLCRRGSGGLCGSGIGKRGHDSGWSPLMRVRGRRATRLIHLDGGRSQHTLEWM